MWLISMFEISENNFILFPFFCLFGNRRPVSSQTSGDNLPLDEWTSVHVHICGDAGDVYTEIDAGTCTVTHCDGAQPHKCDMKLEYI